MAPPGRNNQRPNLPNRSNQNDNTHSPTREARAYFNRMMNHMINKVQKINDKLRYQHKIAATTPVQHARRIITGQMRNMGQPHCNIWQKFRLFISTIFLLTGLLVTPTQGITAYDCSGDKMNITTLSLTEVGKCVDFKPKLEETNITIQLIQRIDYHEVKVTHCKIVVDQTVEHCGMHSHTSAVTGGRRQYMLHTNFSTCDTLHEHNSIDIGGTVLTEIPVNQTSYRDVTLAGSTTTEGGCQVKYSDSTNTWNNVIVRATITIILREYNAPIHMDTNSVIMHSGTRCSMKLGFCIDPENGYSYWDQFSLTVCNEGKYATIKKVKGKKVIDTSKQYGQVVYWADDGKTQFALEVEKEIKICGKAAYATEHPKLFVAEISSLDSRIFDINMITINDLDVNTYMNSKFVYFNHHVDKQLSKLYVDLLEQKCKLERQVLKNALTLATISPEEFAYNIMKGPGWMSVVAGEVAHLIKCLPITVVYRKTEDCYIELPVTYQNNSYFMSPRTHILRKTGTKTECNDIVPQYYYLDDLWYKVLPKTVKVEAPLTLNPSEESNWKYENPGHLASSGIYTAEDMDNLRDRIMFPVERPAILDTVARGAIGQPTYGNNVNFHNLLDEGRIESMVQKAWDKAWGGFVSFGSASAGVLGLFITIRLVKLVFDTVIHGVALHHVYGFSLHLLGALWDSLTNLLLHLGSSLTNTGRREAESEANKMENGENTNKNRRKRRRPSFRKSTKSNQDDDDDDDDTRWIMEPMRSVTFSAPGTPVFYPRLPGQEMTTMPTCPKKIYDTPPPPKRSRETPPPTDQNTPSGPPKET